METGTSYKQNVRAGNPEQYIGTKYMNQVQKILITPPGEFLSAITDVLFLEERLNTKLYLH